MIALAIVPYISPLFIILVGVLSLCTHMYFAPRTFLAEFVLVVATAIPLLIGGVVVTSVG